MNQHTIKRLDEIRKALRKYGFDKILGQTTINMINPVKKGKDTQLLLNKEFAINLRLMFQELGTSFIKLGQLLSTRPDLVGRKISNELSKLQDENPPISYEEVKTVIETELNGNIDEIFLEFKKEHRATASIGQVHEAKLKNGEKVAIKIQKPNINEKIDLDLSIMKFIANEADRINFNSKIKKLNLPGIMEEFDRSIHKEIDYNFELMNMKHIEENFKTNPYIHIPVSYPEYSTRKILTMEFIEGEKLSKVYESKSPKFNKKLIAKRIIDSYLKQIFIDGFFHGDPHPGNILIQKNNTLCYIDLGMMGTLDDDIKRNLSQLMLLFSDRDVDGLITQLIYMDIIDASIDRKQLKRDLTDMFGRYYGAELKRFDGVIEDLLSLMQKYDVTLPNEFVTMARGLSMVEDIGNQLDPEIDIFTSLKPLTRKLLISELNPKKIIKNKKDSFIIYEHALKSLPKLISGTMHKIEKGELKLKFELDGIDYIANKVLLTLIISALLISSSLVMTINRGPMLLDMPIISVIGYLISAILGIIGILKYGLSR